MLTNSNTRRLAFALIVSFSLSSLLTAETTANGDYWTPMTPMPTARSGLGIAVVEGKIYAIGGQNDAIGTYLGTNEMYDPVKETWTTKASMPTPRRNFAIAVYKGKIYCISGESGYDPEGSGGIYSEVNEVYDPVTDTWESKASIPTPRYGMCANVVDGEIYVMGGGHHNVYPGNTCSDKNEAYDPETDTWTVKTALPTAVLNAASAVIADRICMIGGQAGAFLGGWHDFNQVYYVKNNSWSLAAPVPVGVERAAAGATGGFYATAQIYVFGGYTDTSYLPRNLTQVYDPISDAWTSGASMPTPQADFAIAVVNDELYTMGGNASDKYTPAGYGIISSPTPSPEPTGAGGGLPTEAFYAIAVIGIAAIAAIAIAITRRK